MEMHMDKGNVRVYLYDAGEGYDGFYNPDDPTDELLLRFDVHKWDGIDWQYVEDSSYCTMLHAATPTLALGKFVFHIMDEVADDVEAGRSIKRKCERLSWYSPETGT